MASKLGFGAQAPGGWDKLGLISAAIADAGSALGGGQGGATQRFSQGLIGRQQQAQRQQAYQALAGQITDPTQLAAFQLDPDGYLKNYYATQAEAAKPITLGEGQGAYDSKGNLIAGRGKTGISDGFAWSSDGKTGQLSFGAQRPMTYGETETGRHNVATEDLTAGAQAETGRHNLQTERLGMGQLGVAQGQLGVARGQLGLGQQKFAWEQGGGAAKNTQTAQAAFNLPTVIDNATQALKDIDTVKNSPQLGWRTGMSGRIPAIPGSPGAGFDARVAQLQGRSFMQAYDGLRGTGQISEIEGKKATDAIARLDRAQSADDFKTALDDLAAVVRTGMARAQRQAGKAGATSAAAPSSGGWSIVR